MRQRNGGDKNQNMRNKKQQNDRSQRTKNKNIFSSGRKKKMCLFKEIQKPCGPHVTYCKTPCFGKKKAPDRTSYCWISGLIPRLSGQQSLKVNSNFSCFGRDLQKPLTH